MNTDLSLYIDKETVSQMPVVEYPGGIGAITVIDTAAKAKMALRTLNKCTHIGFDTETKPTFQRGGKQHKVALLQLSTGDHCFLFRLNRDGIFDMVRPLLENPDIIKVGLSVHDDYNALRRRGEIEPAGFLDLQDYAHAFHIADLSLMKVYAIIFGKRISKAQRLTNWEADKLTEAQQIYAAIDAWACLKMYRYLRGGYFDPTQSPYLHHPLAEKEAAEAAAETASQAGADTEAAVPSPSATAGTEAAAQTSAAAVS